MKKGDAYEYQRSNLIKRTKRGEEKLRLCEPCLKKGDKNMLSFDEFILYVKNNIEEFMPESFRVKSIEVKEIKKNNGTLLNGLCIHEEDSNITPNIYLEGFYRKYEEGADLPDLLQEIVKVRMKHNKSDINFDIFNDYDLIKKYIFPKIIGRVDWNLDYLSDKPHNHICDLAVVYYVDVTEIFGNNEGTAAVVINNNLMEKWQIGDNDLLFQSFRNLEESEKHNSIFKGMSKVLSCIADDIPGLEELFTDSDELMFVLTSNTNVNGASIILKEGVLRDIYEKIGLMVLIPSSIHEWIIMRAADAEDPEAIRKMIVDINESQVDGDERLSDHPYIFNGKDLAIYE